MLELIKNIPLLLSYFVPGYLARFIFLRLTRVSDNDEKENSTNETIICIVISFVSTSIAQQVILHSEKIEASLLSIIIAVLFSIGISFLYQFHWFQNLFIHTTNTSLQKSIWGDVLPKKKCRLVRCFTEFNHKKASILGMVTYYEVDKNGDCRIALQKCRVEYEENGNIYKNDGNSMIVLSTKDIRIIEVFEHD